MPDGGLFTTGILSRRMTAMRADFSRAGAGISLDAIEIKRSNPTISDGARRSGDIGRTQESADSTPRELFSDRGSHHEAVGVKARPTEARAARDGASINAAPLRRPHRGS